jgi:hypothetical protein
LRGIRYLINCPKIRCGFESVVKSWLPGGENDHKRNPPM